MTKPSTKLLKSVKKMSNAVNQLSFSDPVTHVYNPLDYAIKAHELYIKKFITGTVPVVFMGMNPGPFGMAQTGIPFGEITAVKDWIGIETMVQRPPLEHPKRPIEGFNCTRSEVSGRRLWGLFSNRFARPEAFFNSHFVTNFCPLVFMDRNGRNITPDKLPASEAHPLLEICRSHLLELCDILQPEWLIGIGKYAEKQAQKSLQSSDIKIASILHPSPASPQANKGWSEIASRQLKELGVWS